MGTHVEIGFGIAYHGTDLEKGRDAAHQAVSQLGDITPSLAIVFISAQLDVVQIHQGILAIIGQCRLIGTSSAREIGIARLNEDQWRVIRFLRDYFAYYSRGPLNRDLKKGLKMGLLELEGLFPGGIRRGARRVAGLPNPRTCTG